MTVREAVQLVLQASAMSSGHEIYVLDMGRPVKIIDLARKMITLAGFTPGDDIEIRFTGLRAGEKIFERSAWKANRSKPLPILTYEIRRRAIGSHGVASKDGAIRVSPLVPGDARQTLI